MDSVDELRVGAPAGERARKGLHVVEIRDERTRQALVIESDEPVVGYALERATWEDASRHPDGVIVGQVDGEVWVCFVELTGVLKAEHPGDAPEDRKFSQLVGGAEHFHPGQETTSHGAEHHARWSDGSDPLEVRPQKNHRVVGVAVSNRRMPRPPPRRDVFVGTTRVEVRALSIAQAERNVARTTLRNLLWSAGQPVSAKGG